jgi:EAL domain-containing protein (putative c-di-GMP-specific phosphodiesterase class I)
MTVADATPDLEQVHRHDRAFLGHPKGLGFLGFTEACERFSYYSMQTLLVLYMVNYLLLPEHTGKVVGLDWLRSWHYPGLDGQPLSSAIFGDYTSLVYLTPILGGIIADKLTGRKLALIAGALVMALGHFLMAFEGAFLFALLSLIIGVGLFKGNIATQVGELYSETDLRRALGKDELRLHYQRIVDAKTGALRGHEALVRWQHPERGLVPPGEFIQIAEETGLILKIGERVLREACRWAQSVRGGRELQIAVNLSPRQFADPKLAHVVARSLKESGLPPNLLELEITETLAMQQTDVTLTTLNRLKKLGVSIAIDDFGTGYSSLAYLRRFPVDKLKIDRTFVDDVPHDHEQAAIVSAIVALAHALEIEVIGEGVETVAQREFLNRCGCDYVQGFLIGRPEDPQTAENSLPGT